MNFYETRIGNRLFNSDIPNAIKALNQINNNLEKLTKQLEKKNDELNALLIVHFNTGDTVCLFCDEYILCKQEDLNRIKRILVQKSTDESYDEVVDYIHMKMDNLDIPWKVFSKGYIVDDIDTVYIL